MSQQQPALWSRLRKRGLVPVLAVLGATAFVLLLTLVPRDGTVALQPPRLSLIAGRRGGADLLANIALFVPFGLAFAGARLRLWQTLAAAALLSLFVEVAQLWIPGRASALADVVMNVLGAMAGWSFFRAAAASWRRTRVSAAFVVLVSALPPAIIAGTGWLLTPIVTDGEYRVRWAPPRRGFETYGGAVTAVRIGDQALQEGTPVGVAALLRERLLEGEPLVIEGTAGAPTVRPALVLRVVVRQGDPPRAWETLAVIAYRNDALLLVGQRARRFRLFEPYHRLPDAFASTSRGEPMEIEARRESRRWCLRVGAVSSCRLAFGIGDGWALLMSSLHMSGEARTALSWIWVFLLAVPPGLVAPRRSRSALLHATGVAAAAGLALLLPGTLVLRAWEVGLLAAGYLSARAGAARITGRRTGSAQTGHVSPRQHISQNCHS